MLWPSIAVLNNDINGGMIKKLMSLRNVELRYDRRRCKTRMYTINSESAAQGITFMICVVASRSTWTVVEIEWADPSNSAYFCYICTCRFIEVFGTFKCRIKEVHSHTYKAGTKKAQFWLQKDTENWAVSAISFFNAFQSHCLERTSLCLHLDGILECYRDLPQNTDLFFLKVDEAIFFAPHCLFVNLCYWLNKS